MDTTTFTLSLPPVVRHNAYLTVVEKVRVASSCSQVYEQISRGLKGWALVAELLSPEEKHLWLRLASEEQKDLLVRSQPIDQATKNAYIMYRFLGMEVRSRIFQFTVSYPVLWPDVLGVEELVQASYGWRDFWSRFLHGTTRLSAWASSLEAHIAEVVNTNPAFREICQIGEAYLDEEGMPELKVELLEKITAVVLEVMPPFYHVKRHEFVDIDMSPFPFDEGSDWVDESTVSLLSHLKSGEVSRAEVFGDQEYWDTLLKEAFEDNDADSQPGKQNFQTQVLNIDGEDYDSDYELDDDASHYDNANHDDDELEADDDNDYDSDFIEDEDEDERSFYEGVWSNEDEDSEMSSASDVNEYRAKHLHDFSMEPASFLGNSNIDAAEHPGYQPHPFYRFPVDFFENPITQILHAANMMEEDD